MTNAAMDLRLNEIELKTSELEDQIDALNRTVFRQQQQIDLLVAELRELRGLLAHGNGGDFRSLREEIPPHY